MPIGVGKKIMLVTLSMLSILKAFACLLETDKNYSLSLQTDGYSQVQNTEPSKIVGKTSLDET